MRTGCDDSSSAAYRARILFLGASDLGGRKSAGFLWMTTELRRRALNRLFLPATGTALVDVWASITTGNADWRDMIFKGDWG